MAKIYTNEIKQMQMNGFAWFWENANKNIAQNLIVALDEAASNGIRCVNIVKPETEDCFSIKIERKNNVVSGITLFTHIEHNLNVLYKYLCECGFVMSKAEINGVITLHAAIPYKL